MQSGTNSHIGKNIEEHLDLYIRMLKKQLSFLQGLSIDLENPAFKHPLKEAKIIVEASNKSIRQYVGDPVFPQLTYQNDIQELNCSAKMLAENYSDFFDKNVLGEKTIAIAGYLNKYLGWKINFIDLRGRIENDVVHQARVELIALFKAAAIKYIHQHSRTMSSDQLKTSLKFVIKIFYLAAIKKSDPLSVEIELDEVGLLACPWEGLRNIFLSVFKQEFPMLKADEKLLQLKQDRVQLDKEYQASCQQLKELQQEIFPFDVSRQEEKEKCRNLIGTIDQFNRTFTIVIAKTEHVASLAEMEIMIAKPFFLSIQEAYHKIIRKGVVIKKCLSAFESEIKKLAIGIEEIDHTVESKELKLPVEVSALDKFPQLSSYAAECQMRIDAILKKWKCFEKNHKILNKLNHFRARIEKRESNYAELVAIFKKEQGAYIRKNGVGDLMRPFLNYPFASYNLSHLGESISQLERKIAEKNAAFNVYLLELELKEDFITINEWFVALHEHSESIDLKIRQLREICNGEAKINELDFSSVQDDYCHLFRSLHCLNERINKALKSSANESFNLLTSLLERVKKLVVGLLERAGSSAFISRIEAPSSLRALTQAEEIHLLCQKMEILGNERRELGKLQAECENYLKVQRGKLQDLFFLNRKESDPNEIDLDLENFDHYLKSNNQEKLREKLFQSGPAFFVESMLGKYHVMYNLHKILEKSHSKQNFYFLCEQEKIFSPANKQIMAEFCGYGADSLLNYLRVFFEKVIRFFSASQYQPNSARLYGRLFNCQNIKRATNCLMPPALVNA